MKKFFTFISCTYLAVSSVTNAQTYNLYWDKTYGGDNRDWNCQIVTGNSGQIFLIGDVQTDINSDKTVPLCILDSINNSDIWLIKIDSSGAILWQKDLGANSDERYPQIIPLNNANKETVFACLSVSDTACDKTEHNRDTIPLLSADYWICLLDSNGMKIWDKTLGGDNNDDYPQIIKLSTGELMVSGESNSPVSGDKTIPNYSISNDYWTVKLSSSGTLLWDKVHGGTAAEFLTSAIAMPGGSFVLGGSTNSDVSGDVSELPRGNYDYWMIKIDNAGNKIWDHRYGGSSADRCNHILNTPDNGFILCGYTLSPVSGEVSQPPKGIQDYWIIKTDSLGNKQWDKRFGGNNSSSATWIESASTGGYWLAGYTNSDNVIDVTEPSYGGSDYWVLRIDSSGNKLWDKRFGGNQNEISTSFSLLADSSLILFGYSDSGYSAVKTALSKGMWDYWLIKFRYSFPTGIDEFSFTPSLFSVYPNPGDGYFTVQYSSDAGLIGDVAVYDLMNREIFSNNNVLINNYPLDLRNFSKGIYFLRISRGSSLLFSEKLVRLF